MVRRQQTQAETDTLSRLGLTIRNARETRGWSRFRVQLAVREAFPGEDLTTEALRLIETGRCNPQPRTLAKIRKILPEIGRY